MGYFLAIAMSGLDREASEKEISGSLACDGFVSALSSLFGCLPITSFSQNVFAENCVAVVFIVAVVLNLILPKDMEACKQETDAK